MPLAALCNAGRNRHAVPSGDDKFTPARIASALSHDSVYIDEPFQLTLTLELTALPAPHTDTPPLLPSRPPHIESPLFDLDPPPGIRGPDLRAWLESRLLPRTHRTAGFTINRYTIQPDLFSGFFPFGLNPDGRERQAVFDLPRPTRREQGGRRNWRYQITFDYHAEREGDYVFGPVQLTGPVVIAVDAAGNPKHQQVDIQSAAQSIRVLPPPLDGRPDSFVGVSGRSMRLQVRIDPQVSRLGDPLRLKLDLTGAFPIDSLVPPALNRQPALAERFRIHVESVETIKLADGKRFVYRIRPLSAGTQTVPAIEVAYFDTRLRDYRRLQSDPIPIQVHPGPELEITLDETVFDSEAGMSQAVALTMLQNLPAGLALPGPPTHRFPGAARWPWMAGPALYGLAGLLRGTMRKVEGNRQRKRRRRIADTMQRRLQPACSVGDLRTLLTRYLVGGWGIAPGRMTPADLERALLQAGLPAALTADWRTFLSDLEPERYSPANAGRHANPNAATQLANLIRQTEAHADAHTL